MPLLLSTRTQGGGNSVTWSIWRAVLFNACTGVLGGEYSVCICCAGEKAGTQATEAIASNFPSLVVIVLQETLQRLLCLSCFWK